MTLERAIGIVLRLLTATRMFLLGHTKLESTIRYLGVEVEDALEISEQADV